MNRIISKRVIKADIDKIWPLIEDITLIDTWHPGVETTDQLSDNAIGMGAVRRCNFYNGNQAVEEVIALDKNYRIQINIREFKAPMKHFISTWQLTKMSDGATQVSITTEYQMKFGVIGKIMDHLMIKPKMPKLIDRVLAGLDHHVMSGKRINQDFNLKPVAA